MTPFETAINNLDEKSAYIFVGEQLVKADRVNITGDIAQVFLATPINGGIRVIFMHIHNLVLAGS